MRSLLIPILAAAVAAVAVHFAQIQFSEEGVKPNTAITGGVAGAVAAVALMRTRGRGRT